MIKIKANSAIKQSLLYGGSVAIMKGVSLLMLPFIANQINSDEFGRLEVISTLAVMASIVIGMGLEDTLFRFAGTEKSASKRRQLSAEIFTLTLFIATLTLLTGCLMATWLSEIFPAPVSVYEIRLVLAALALEGCIAIPLGWLRMNDKALSFFSATTGRALIQALLVFVFLLLDRGVTGILEAGLIAALIQVILLAYLQLSDTGIKVNLTTFKKAYIYSLPIVGSGLVAFTLNGLDRWVLVEHVELEKIAQFAIASKFALATVLLMQPFGMWWSPRRFDVLNSNNGPQKVTQIISLGTSMALIISVLVSMLAPFLIVQLLPDNYAPAAHLVLAIIIVMLLKELVELFNIGCFHGHTTHTQLLINLFTGFIGVVLMLWLTPIYLVWGVIFALLAAQSLRLLLFYFISQYFLPLNYPTHKLLLMALASSVWGVLSINIGIHSLSITILLTSSAALSLLALANYLTLIPFKFSSKRWMVRS